MVESRNVSAVVYGEPWPHGLSLSVQTVRAFASLFLLWLASCGCAPIGAPPESGGEFNNTTDPTNKGASYIGSAACSACHPSIAERHQLHGHSHILNKVEGDAPSYPEQATRAGVPNPPAGVEWSDIAYIIGGYIRKAAFVHRETGLLTNGPSDAPVQWNLTFPANGTVSGFADDEPPSGSVPYDFSCFQCHTTGPQPSSSEHQDNQPGIAGTWAEAGVQCEACHGPGSNHIPDPHAREIYVGNSAPNCGRCHSRNGDPSLIEASDGFIANYQQWSELKASGGHSNFSCVTCHDPHAGTNYDRPNAIRNECAACHSDQNMAIHDGFVFVRGNYTEQVTCVSCHMPYATRSAASASPEVVGNVGRVADLKTHIFRINTEPVDYSTFFSSDGSMVAKDDQGLAAVTLDFICFRCHNGIGSAGEIDSIDLAAGVAENIHSITRPE